MLAITAICLNGSLTFRGRRQIGSPLNAEDYKCAKTSMPEVDRVPSPEEEAGTLAEEEEARPRNNRVEYNVHLRNHHLYKIFVNEEANAEDRILYVENTVDSRIAGREEYEFIDFYHNSYHKTQIAILDASFKTRYAPRIVASNLKDQLVTRNSYADLSRSQYLIEGRLVSTYDFVYRSQQLGAYLSAVTRPMWKNVENNWIEIEMAIRDLAIGRATPLTIFNGTVGTQTFTNENGLPIRLYLHNDERTVFQNIPEIFFKFLYDRQTRECVGIVVHNATYKFGKKCEPVTSLAGELARALKDVEIEGVATVSYACACNTYWPQQLPAVDIVYDNVLGSTQSQMSHYYYQPNN